MRVNQLKAGVVLSYANQALHFIISIIYTPVMLGLLGQSEYGLYQLVSSVVAYLGLLNMGFSSGYVRFFAKNKAAANEEGMADINGMFFIIFSVLAAICLLCGGVMLTNMRAILGPALSEQELYRAKILMAFLIFNMAISFGGNVFSCNIISEERFFFLRIIDLLKTIFNPFLTLPLLLMGYGSVGMVVVSSTLTAVSVFLHIWYSISKLHFKLAFKRIKFSLFKEMWAFTFFIFINMIVDQINWNVDKLLIGRIINIEQVSVYSIGAQLNTLYITFSTVVSSVFVPKVNMMAENKEGDDLLTKLFARVGRVQCMIIMLIMSGYIFFGKVFIKLWVGDAYASAYWVGLLLMLPATIPLIQNLGIEIQRAKNKHKFRSYLYLGMAFANVILSIPLLKKFGVVGAPLGTAISMLICNCLIMNVFYHRVIGLDMIYFWKEIGKFVPAIILIGGCGCMVKQFLLRESILSFLVSVGVYCILYGFIMWLLGMNEEEKGLVAGPLKKIGKKLCRK